MKVFKNKDQMFTFIFGCGLGGVIVSFIEGARAGAKASKACEEANTEKLIDKIMVGGKYFTIPTLILFASCCGITIPYVKEKRRNAALSALLASTAASYELYKDKVNELMPEKAKEIKKKIFEDTVKHNPQTSENTVKFADYNNYGQTQTFYDVCTGLYFESSVSNVERAFNVINKMLTAGDMVTVNDLYFELGGGTRCNPLGKVWDTMSWNYDDIYRLIEPEFGSMLINDKPYITLEYERPNLII